MNLRKIVRQKHGLKKDTLIEQFQANMKVVAADDTPCGNCGCVPFKGEQKRIICGPHTPGGRFVLSHYRIYERCYPAYLAPVDEMTLDFVRKLAVEEAAAHHLA